MFSGRCLVVVALSAYNECVLWAIIQTHLQITFKLISSMLFHGEKRERERERKKKLPQFKWFSPNQTSDKLSVTMNKGKNKKKKTNSGAKASWKLDAFTKRKWQCWTPNNALYVCMCIVHCPVCTRIEMVDFVTKLTMWV